MSHGLKTPTVLLLVLLTVALNVGNVYFLQMIFWKQEEKIKLTRVDNISLGMDLRES